MNNKYLKLGIIMAASIIGLMGINAAQAQGLSSNASTGQQAFCPRDFGNFLAIGMNFEGEGFWDYWKDILDIPGVLIIVNFLIFKVY